MENEREVRAALPVEVRAVEGEGEGVKVGGYAAIYDEWADIGGYFLERIAPGALDGRLGDDVQFLVEHRGLPLARTTSGTLKLSLDARGLYMETTLDPSDPDAARVVSKLKRGDLSKMSFAFRVAKEEWDETGDVPRRTITQISRLHDVAVVADPAYAGTEIALRSLEAHRAQADQSHPAARTRLMEMRLRLAAQD